MAKRGQANKMKFFNINASLVNEFGIKAILDEVYENAPAVIFIDEIDLLGLQRVGNNKLLSDFLTAMQSSMNADPAKIVIVIAATNKPENIDSALRQNGRFGKEIRFDYPSRKYRVKFLIRELVNMALNIKEFDIETLADKTNDKTFEDLKRIIRNAMTRSWMHGSSLTQKLLEESIDTEINNLIVFNRKDLPEKERRILATHFAGMALAAMHLATHELLDKVTTYAHMANIKDEGVWENYSKKEENSEQKKIEYGKFIAKQPHDTINVKDGATIINEATLLLAGFAAEELLLGPCGFTCHRNDEDKAYKLLEELVFGGLLQESLPKSIREELKLKAYSMQKQCQKNAMDLLIEHKDALIAIAEELMQKQILNDKEVKAIIDKVENPSPAEVPTIEETPTIAEPTTGDDDENQSLDGYRTEQAREEEAPKIEETTMTQQVALAIESE
jgi:cell division protease FtsH